ncbi:MAG: polyprenyl synthetase family protein [Pseudomonadota bacterium]
MKSIRQQNTTESKQLNMISAQDVALEYAQVEKRAKWYVARIQALARDPNTLARLHNDYHSFWKDQKKQSPVRKRLMQSAERGNIGTWPFLFKLHARKELDSYLTKTISYLYLRDLGMDLSQAHARKKVEQTVNSLIKSIEKGHAKSSSAKMNDDEFLLLQPWLAKKHYQPAYYWLMLKLSGLKRQLDDGLDNQDGFRKLVKVIAGILMHHFITRPATAADKDTPEQVMTTVQLGYAYGLTYPFVDDLLDTDAFLSTADKVTFTHALRQTLQTGVVVDYPAFENDSKRLSVIFNELKWAFEFLQTTLPENQRRLFFLRANVFFEAQSIDRQRSLDDAEKYSLQEQLVSVILKSSSSRLISRDLITDASDNSFDLRTFCFGIYNQFNDDIKDIEEDRASRNLTPYTWYLALRDSQHAIDNPYESYWAVVYFLVYDIYKNDPQIKQLFFERTMNAHMSVYKCRGQRGYLALKKALLHTQNKAFDSEFTRQVTALNQDIWFDKLISKEVSTWMHTKREQSLFFKSSYRAIKDDINRQLVIQPQNRFAKGKLHTVANYALGAGGKRIRAVIATTIARDLYGFDDVQQTAVNQLLEYMHSASLILDDLPSQDDAALRRGLPSTHVKFHSVAKAELGAVFLMMKAIEVQASIDCHPPSAVLDSIRYAANTTQAICEGQLLDIETSGQPISQACLEKICRFKTGLAIEAAFVVPALLAERDELHIKQMKNLAKHIGMAFQIRDDLLDVTGDVGMTGKPTGADEKCSRMNFVSVYGEYRAIEVMLAHYNEARSIVAEMPAIRLFFNELLDFIIYRDQ